MLNEDNRGKAVQCSSADESFWKANIEHKPDFEPACTQMTWKSMILDSQHTSNSVKSVEGIPPAVRAIIIAVQFSFVLEEELFHKNRLISENLFWDWHREDQNSGINFEKRPYQQMLSIKSSLRQYELQQYHLIWKKWQWLMKDCADWQFMKTQMVLSIQTWCHVQTGYDFC